MDSVDILFFRVYTITLSHCMAHCYITCYTEVSSIQCQGAAFACFSHIAGTTTHTVLPNHAACWKKKEARKCVFLLK